MENVRLHKNTAPCFEVRKNMVRLYDIVYEKRMNLLYVNVDGNKYDMNEYLAALTLN